MGTLSYSERMRLGEKAAIAAGVDPSTAKFVASKYAPADDSLPGPWSRAPGDTTPVVAAVKELGQTLNNAGNAFNPIKYGQDTYNMLLGNPSKALFADVGKALDEGFTSPNERAARAAPAAAIKPRTAADILSASGPRNQPSGLKISTFSDPRWGSMEAQAAKEVGVPGMEQYLAAIRTRGERSNPGQTNSNKTFGVYQFIPATAAGLKRNYGVDVYAGPEQEALGAALLFKENLKRANGDPVQAVRAHVGGWDASQYGPQTAAYVNRVTGVGGAGGGLAGMTAGNPFDPSLYNAALGMNEQARQAGLQPTTVNYDRGPAPELPGPMEIIKTDWTAADASLAALEPAAIQEVEARQLRRDNWMKGLAQGLAALPEGAGLGKVLASFGAGGMMGLQAGNDQVRQKITEYDAKMAQWKQAVYGQDVRKAQSAQQEAQLAAKSVYDHGMMAYAQAKQAFDGMAPVIANGMVITRGKNADGTEKLTTTPIASLVNAAAYDRAAGILQAEAGAANQGAAFEANAKNGILGAMAKTAMTLQMQQGAAAQDAGTMGVGVATASQAASIVQNGGLPELVGEDDYKRLIKEATKYAVGVAAPGTSGYQEALQNYLTTQLTQVALGNRDKAFAERFTNAAGLGMSIDQANRMRSGKTRVSSGPRGTTTSREYEE